MSKTKEHGKVRQWELYPNAGDHNHRHVDGTETTYQGGEVIHDPRDLNTLFPCKFTEIGVSKKATKKDLRPKDNIVAIEDDEEEDAKKNPPQEEEEEDTDLHEEEKDEDDSEDEEKDETAVKSKFGTDATGEFDLAVKSDLKVFKSKKKGLFTVVDADEPTKALKKGMKTPGQVQKFLKGYRKG